MKDFAAILATQTALAALGELQAAASPAAKLHPQMGEQHALLCDDPTIDVATKNRALKGTHGPHCAVQIMPFGAATGYTRL